jgi:hypothetical protein
LGRCFLSPSGTYACYYDPVGGECAPWLTYSVCGFIILCIDII